MSDIEQFGVRLNALFIRLRWPSLVVGIALVVAGLLVHRRFLVIFGALLALVGLTSGSS